MNIVKAASTLFNLSRFHNFINIFRRPQLQLIGAPNFDEDTHETNSNNKSIFDSILLFAVPKSKVSTGRKRMGHFRMKPDPVGWTMCEKCGEPKRPHR